MNITLFDRAVPRLKVASVRELSPTDPLVIEAADFLGLHRSVHPRTTTPSGDPARGCYLIGTAVTEASGDEEVRKRLASALSEFEEMVAARIQQARDDGEIEATADPQALAMITLAVLYTMAIRARAGESRAILSGDERTIDRRERDAGRKARGSR